MQYNSLQEGTRMPRLKGSADLLEDRRRRALALWDTGLSLNEVGRRIPCAPSSVLRWLRARRRGGPDALRVRFSPGRPLKFGGEPAAPLGEAASPGTPGPRLPDAVVD